MDKFGKKTRKGIFTITYIFLLLFFLWPTLFEPLINEFASSGPIYSDVAKRIESPDGTKTALLIRRNANTLGLHFAVKIKEGFIPRKLHWTGYFKPNQKADWNEKIIWSDDSSFIVLTVDDVQNNNEKYMWAYDFRDGKEYRDKDTIFSIMNSRSKIPPLMPSPH